MNKLKDLKEHTPDGYQIANNNKLSELSGHL